MGNRIKLLDCTLRDGGLGLEDALKYYSDLKLFDNFDMNSLSYCLKESNIDIIELGSIEISDDAKSSMAIYQNIEQISEVMPKNKNPDQMFVALYRGPDTELSSIPDWCPTYCQGLRVILRYSELQKSLDFCAGLVKKGYKVFVQPMLTMRYNESELKMIIDATNKMKAYALYFVDSYGYMTSNDIISLFKLYDTNLLPSIRIGFHGHNNMNLAYANALSFISQSTHRGIIVDSCILGMGQGAGNLQTELISHYLNSNYDLNYDYDLILDACEIVEKYGKDNIWGYSVIRLLPAIHNTAYKYSVDLRNLYHLSFREINNIFQNIDEELRHRYTVENTIKLLRLAGYSNQIMFGDESERS